MSAALLLPFAKRLSDEKFVSPDEVPRGQACNCVCPGCEHPVVAKQGTEKAWHFAHMKASDCANAYEKSVHELAKQLIRERKLLRVPAFAVRQTAWDAFGTPISAEEIVFESKLVSLDTCVAGKVLGEVSPDLVGAVGDREILVEITVFHRLMPEKRDRLLQTGKAVVEIDLGVFKSVQASRELLEHELFGNHLNRRWIYHPRQAEVAARLRTQLQAQIDESRVRFEEHQKLKAEREANEAHRKAELAAVLATQVAAVHQFDATNWWQPKSHSLPVPDDFLEWRASFPTQERWERAREAFCARFNLDRGKVGEVMEAYSKRSHLANITPQKLAAKWATDLSVSAADICQYFREAGYTLDA